MGSVFKLGLRAKVLRLEVSDSRLQASGSGLQLQCCRLRLRFIRSLV